MYIKTCAHCNNEFEAKYSNKIYCKQSCKVMAAQKVWRVKLKQKAIQYLGGKCKLCGYDKCHEALDFHHRNPKEKEFGICSDGQTRSWTRVKAELDKCDLLCCRCHREVHYNLRNSVRDAELVAAPDF